MKYDFIRRECKEYKVIRLCEALEVSSSGFYDWLDRPESPRARANRELTAKIRAYHKQSREENEKRMGSTIEFSEWQPLLRNIIIDF